MEHHKNNDYPPNPIPTHHYKALVYLNIIANIPKYSKINTSDNSIVPAKSLWGACKRFLNDENRQRNIKTIADHINTGLKILPTLESKQQERDFLKALEGCKRGLKNLLETYNDDVNMVAEINVLIDQIDKVLEK